MCQQNNEINKDVPNWAKGAVFYHIFPDRFSRDNNEKTLPRNYTYYGRKVENVEDWNSEIETFDVHRMYGGNLPSIINKLDYLEELGIEGLYLSPIFLSPSSHGYDIMDYNVNPFMGKIINEHNGDFQKIINDPVNINASNEVLIELVQKAHDRGIKVILDGVFNHCSNIGRWMNQNKLYPTSEERPEFFKWNCDGTHDGWWGFGELPKLNYEGSKELMDEIIKIGVKFVSEPYNIDGWRLDVAEDLGYSQGFNKYFWREFRKAVKEANPEAILIAEFYGDPYEYLQGEYFDSIMGYQNFNEPVSWFFTGMEKHSDEFRPDLLGNADYFEWRAYDSSLKMPLCARQTSLNQLSNHDMSRFLTRTNMQVGRLYNRGNQAADEGINKAIFKEATVMLMTYEGIASIYYGDEIGMTGWTDPHNRKSMQWDNQDTEMLFFHKEIIKIRKQHQTLKLGSTHFLYKHNANKCLSFARCYNDEKFVIAFNNDNRTHTYKIKVDSIGIEKNTKMQVLIMTDEKGYTLGGENLSVVDGHVEITLPPYSSIVMKN